VAEHQQIVRDLLPTSGVTRVPLRAALGRVLAGDQSATVCLPSFDNSAMDGYAVRAAEIQSASENTPIVLPVAEDIPAGRLDIPALAGGTAHRIMTGAPLPAGADAVVEVEVTDGGTETVAIRAARPAGTHVRFAGEDVKLSDRVLADGVVLGPGQLGLLAAVGCAEVPIRTPLRVLVLSTGTELVPAGQALERGQIHDSNGPMLAAAVDDAGAQALLLRSSDDDVDEFRRLLCEHLDSVDLIVTTGGVSAGAYEVVKDALAGADVEFTRLAMQPGMPQGAGRFRGVPIIAFPGTPISALVSFEVLLRPALRAMIGYRKAERPKVAGTLAEPCDSRAGRRQFRRGRYDALTGRVSLVSRPAMHFLHSLADSNCLVDIPEDVIHMEAGQPIVVWDLE
jgi:molybdopterin molybdotransferase